MSSDFFWIPWRYQTNLFMERRGIDLTWNRLFEYHVGIRYLVLQSNTQVLVEISFIWNTVSRLNLIFYFYILSQTQTFNSRGKYKMISHHTNQHEQEGIWYDFHCDNSYWFQIDEGNYRSSNGHQQWSQLILYHVNSQL